MYDVAVFPVPHPTFMIRMRDKVRVISDENASKGRSFCRARPDATHSVDDRYRGRRHLVS